MPQNDCFADVKELQSTPLEKSAPAPDADSSTSTNMSLEQLTGNVLRLAKSHNGSRIIQQKLDAKDSRYVNVCFTEMKEHVAELMSDNFGHFAIGL
jgi:hypothetical protein